MRYLAPGAGDFDRDYLDGGSPAEVRDATWADLPGASVLYNHPEPRWIVKDYLSESFRDTRYESHFVKTLRRLEGRRGFCLTLENANRRVVGLATVERRGTFAEQHTGILSFRVVPAFSGQVVDLLDAVVERCAALEIAVLNVYLADCDIDQKQLLEEVGFGEEARFKRRLWVDGRYVDMVVYARTLAQTAAALFEEGDYYGGRKDWQRERAGSAD